MIRKIAIFYLIAVVFFFWGAAVAHFHIFPWSIIVEVNEFITFQDGNEKSLTDRVLVKHQEKKSNYRKGGFIRRDQNFIDNGFLMISRFSRDHDQVIIELFDIENENVIHTWIPDLDAIFQMTPKSTKGSNTHMAYRAQHPLLLYNGDVLITSGEGPLVRINPCGEPVWAIDKHFHHSIELDANGNIIVPIRTKKKNQKNFVPIRGDDEGIAIVDQNGVVLNIYSITDTLIKDGYRGLLYGVGEFQVDRIHLNDAQPINENIKGSFIGDIAWSSRHLSAVGLFRPSTGKMVWVKVGPWLAQHDINLLYNGNFSIFGNDIARINQKNPLVKKGGYSTQPWANENKNSEIYIFNPITKEITTPYTQMMIINTISTKSSGRSRVLSNGDVYIEETDNGRLIRISKDKIRWEYINLQTKKTVGALHWSRYLYQKEVNLSWRNELKCK
jgi:Arylsulfotransferase (ASST)